MKLFIKRLKPWFKPFKKKAAEKKNDYPPPPKGGAPEVPFRGFRGDVSLLKLHSMTHQRLASYAEQIGIAICSRPNSYATELAMQMMDAAYLFNEAYTDWKSTPNNKRQFEVHNKVRKTRSELCEWLNRIAYHYMQTEKDYVKALTEAGFEVTRRAELPKAKLPRLIERVKQQ